MRYLPSVRGAVWNYYSRELLVFSWYIRVCVMYVGFKYMYVYIYIYICMCVCTFICVCMYVCVCVRLYVYVCMYVYTRSVRKVSDLIFLCEHLMDYNLARLHEPTLNLSAHA